jgi:peptide/nickel transport system ATP-binding protein
MQQTPTATDKQSEVDTSGERSLVSVENLQTRFAFEVGTVHAVEDVSFDLSAGKTLGVVGESGCGKSVTAQSIMRIVPKPGKITRGTITFRDYDNTDEAGKPDEVDLTSLDPTGERIRSIRGNKISMIFQEPMTAFSLQYRVVDQVAEPLFIHGVTDDKNEAFDRAEEMFRRRDSTTAAGA